MAKLITNTFIVFSIENRENKMNIQYTICCKVIVIPSIVKKKIAFNTTVTIYGQVF